MGKRYTVCTIQIRKMPVLERYLHVYWDSSQRIMKYAQSSLFAASDIVGLFSSLIIALGGAGAASAAAAGLAWAVAWRFSRAVRSDASVRSSVS